MIHKPPRHAGVSARDKPGTDQKTTTIGWTPIRLNAMPPLWVLIAERRMWLTDLKGNYWRESLSMPLTDNQLIIVLIIYSSPSRPLSILLTVSLMQSTETFIGLAGSPLWWSRVKTTMLALASLHFLHSEGLHPTYQPSQGRWKIKENQHRRQQHMQPLSQAGP